MITKNELIELWIKYHNENVPKLYEPLFTQNGFMKLIQGTFMTKSEIDYYTNTLVKNGKRYISVYGSRLLNKDYSEVEWTEKLWNELLQFFIHERLTHNDIHYHDEIIKGITVLLCLNIKHLTVDEVPDEYKRFYNGTDFGYFNIPFIIDVTTFLKMDISEYLKSYIGFVEESSIPKFDLCDWKNKFKTSNQITTLKDTVSHEYISIDDMPKYDDGTVEHFKAAEKYYPYVEKITMIQDVIGHYIPLRKVNNGSSFIEELIDDYGWLAGFYHKKPIYKINTVQGFAFYICGSDWSGGVYIDDISIKKIKFGHKKPENLDIEKTKRIFIVYNKETGYWQLPELYYPVKFKNFIKDILKTQNKTIGKWNETVVYANSRTLNGDTYYINTEDYPDIRTKDEFITKIIENAAAKAIKGLNLNKQYTTLGLKIKVEFENKFDFDKIVKPLNCITQQDINLYLKPDNNTLPYTIENY